MSEPLSSRCEAADKLAQAVREFLAGRAYRSGAPLQEELDALALKLGAYDSVVRRNG